MNNMLLSGADAPKNITISAKNELCETRFDRTCCRVAELSAFVRTAGSLVFGNGAYGFSVTSQSICVEHFANTVKELYNARAEFTDGKNGFSGFVVRDGAYILRELGILGESGGGISVNLSPDGYLTENECCKRAYAAGAFLGGGSLTVPEVNATNGTGYHMEFVFSKYVTAAHLSDLLSDCGFLPKLIERKNNFIVYFKQSEEITDLLVFIGANRAALALSQLVVLKDVKNNVNCATNCEMHNVTKQVDASLKYRAAIKNIKETAGLEALSSQLRAAAEARLKYRDATLSDLAKLLGISKSCLNHRLRKLVEISDEL